MMLGIVYSLANIILPIMGWTVYQNKPTVEIFGFLSKVQFADPHQNFLTPLVSELYNWNFFLLLCALPSLLGGIGICFMPESPKFLMTAGRNEEALDIFKKVYATNSGKPPESYPIKALVDEVKQITTEKTKKQAMQEGLVQLKPLIKPPYLSKFILVCLIQTSIVTG